MKRAAVCLGLLAVACSTGCWRPYYRHRYAQPAYPQPAAYSQPAPPYVQPPLVQSQPAPIVQQQPVLQQAPLVQGYQPAYCQPCQPCQPCPTYCTPCY